MSRPSAARKSPVTPPIVKSPMKPRMYIIGVCHETDARYSVAVQLKTLIADGTATKKLKNAKIIAEYIEMPATNMWCAHTRKPRNAIASEEYATRSEERRVGKECRSRWSP